MAKCSRETARDPSFWTAHPVAPALIAGIVALAGLPAVAQQTPLDPPPRPALPDPVPQELPPPPTPRPPVPAIEGDGPAFEVVGFDLRYPVPHPSLPPIADLLAVRTLLSIREDGVYVAPRPGTGLEAVPLALADLAAPGRARRQFAVSAINAIGASIVEELNRRGLIGVLVLPDPAQIDPETLQDRRPPEVRRMTLDVWTRTVGEVRTLGDGPRWIGEPRWWAGRRLDDRINHPAHRLIRENSPLQPAAAVAGADPGDLLRADEIENYLFRLNRHPGRRVEAAIGAGERPGEITLDYIVAENKPWTAYFQLSNTGTEQTNEWRQRFGFIHHQLSNRDDILSIDYITAGFSDAHAVLASYSVPVWGLQTLRARAYGSWSDWTASDVGFVDEEFEGQSWSLGGELIANVLQVRRSFVDVFAGARFQNVRVRNVPVDIEGDADFFIPYIGARFERETFSARTDAEIRFETNLPGVAGTDSAEIQRLGRLNVDRDWTVLRWRAGHSFFLEPLLLGARWFDPSTPAGRTTLAHEIALSARGQHAFGNRLIPQEQETIGGFFSVRGYPESILAGDNVYIASAEYRLHIPRLLHPREPGRLIGEQPFRWAREQQYGLPDWDFIIRGFFDIGRATQSDAAAFEIEETLMGAGIGAELQVWRNLNLRLDWGFALEEVRDVDSGDNRLHFIGTLLF
jgi:hypothetical protein